MALSVLLVACSPTARSAANEPSEAENAASRPTPPADATQTHAPREGWQSTLDGDHALVGVIWSVDERRAVSRDELLQALDGHVHIALGETHDNPDHHQLQAELIDALSEDRNAVVFEMIEREQSELARSALRDGVEALREAVDWSNSGWPAFEIYAPVFAATREHALTLQGAGVSREQLAPLYQGKPIEGELSSRFDLSAPLDGSLQDRWLDELAEAHCGAMPKEALGPMLAAQRLRDAAMAAALADQGAGFLVAGSGHVRRDRAVPALLGGDDSDPAGAAVASLAFVEVDPSWSDTDALAAADLPFDYVWVTPGVERPDPCDAFRHGSKTKDATEDVESNSSEGASP